MVLLQPWKMGCTVILNDLVLYFGIKKPSSGKISLQVIISNINIHLWYFIYELFLWKELKLRFQLAWIESHFLNIQQELYFKEIRFIFILRQKNWMPKYMAAHWMAEIAWYIQNIKGRQTFLQKLFF